MDDRKNEVKIKNRSDKEIQEAHSDLTKEEVGYNGARITSEMSNREYGMELVKMLEDRLAKTLSNQINERIKPLKQSKIEYLEQELNVANYILMEIQETVLGMFVLRQVYKRIRKDTEKSKKSQEDAKQHINDLIKDEIRKEGSDG